MSRVRIVFKSGHVQEVECKSFAVEKSADKIAALRWENTKPEIMQIDLDQIAAIFQVK